MSSSTISIELFNKFYSITPHPHSFPDSDRPFQQPGRDGLPDGGAHHVQVPAPQHRPLHRCLLRKAAPLHRPRTALRGGPQTLPQRSQAQTGQYGFIEIKKIFTITSKINDTPQGVRLSEKL